jgi:transcription termination factor NusB
MDAKTQKDFIKLLIRRLRETTEELYAYRVTANIAEDTGFPFAATLENALGHPAIKARAKEELKGLEDLIDNHKDSTDDQIKEFLRNWKPEGTPN